MDARAALDVYAPDYFEARDRFRSAAASVDATVESHTIAARIAGDDDSPLTIDVATLGPEHGPTIVISSGVHGVEGFMGSAVQLAWLQRLRKAASPSPSLRWVFIHAVNPFGFADVRRFNEDNIDLNRNFLLPGTEYRGTPDGYDQLFSFLNPKSPPSLFEPFRIKALLKILRFGLQPIKQAVAAGQYDHPQGIFFGGQGPGESTKIIQDNIARWLSQSDPIVHVDFHTGLGKFAHYKLLLAELAGSPQLTWYDQAFGAEFVEATPEGDSDATAYRSNGPFGEWLQHHFSDRTYRFVTAEFGTYDPIRVLGSIRAENRAHHYGSRDPNAFRRAKQELLRVLLPPIGVLALRRARVRTRYPGAGRTCNCQSMSYLRLHASA